jgi:hypothetical protein
MQSTDMQATPISHHMSPEAILHEWRAMGATTIEELAARVSELTGAEAASRRVPLDLESELARTLTHRPMQHTVIVETAARPLTFSTTMASRCTTSCPRT